MKQENNIPEIITPEQMQRYCLMLDQRNDLRKILFECYEFFPLSQEYRLKDKNKIETIKHIFTEK